MYMFSKLNLFIVKLIWMLTIKKYIIELNYILMLKSFVLWNNLNIFYKMGKNLCIPFEPIEAIKTLLKPSEKCPAG